MVTTLCLLSCVLAAAQPAPPPPVGGPSPRPGAPPREPAGGWLLAPRLGAAQELVYTGTFEEQAHGGAVQFKRSYRLENRVFVLEAAPQGPFDVAILTVLKDRPASGIPAPRRGGEDVARSARLERARVDAQGRVTLASKGSTAVPLEGPPTIECGAFVPAPRGSVRPGQPWTVQEPGRPEWRWEAVGTEAAAGALCLKLVGVQQSDDWERPRADRTAWRRQDTVWLSSRTGVAQRVERVVQRRLPAREAPTHEWALRYELESSPQYPAALADDLRRDIEQAGRFQAAAAPYLGQPSRFGRELAALHAQIGAYLERQPPTPYREAVVQVRSRVEAARRGEVPPPLPTEPTEPESPTAWGGPEASVGRRAPDFVAPDLTNPNNSAGLRQWRGRPVLLVFYNPASRNLDDLMRLVQKVGAEHPEVAVVGLAMSGDAAAAAQQRLAKGWKFPVLSGSGLRISYGVDCTPKLVLVGAEGVVRASVVGWGSETPGEVAAELRAWLRN